ncbi:MAG: MASE1 domain-containing protein, partial [Ardenticatenales bacterium]|nr:MASE1 domain-containing protein [Ardenticatenales bacterium]
MVRALKQIASHPFAQIVLLALLYYVSGRLGQLTALPGTQATPVWPPSGIAQAALLLLGYRVWPGIFLGAFFANIWPFWGNESLSQIGLGSVVALVIAIGSTFQALLGSYLLKRFGGVSNPLERVRDIFFFVIFSALLSCVVSPTFGTTILSLTGFSPWANYQAVWRTWWLGDVVGVIIFTPLLLSWRKWLEVRLQPQQIAEATLFLLLALLVGHLSFRVGAPVEYMFIPLLLAGVFRFGQVGALSISLLASAMAIVGTINGIGSFARASLNESLLSLIAFLAVITITALVLAASFREREVAEQALDDYTRDLEKRVKERTAHLERRSVQLQVAAEVARDATTSTHTMDDLLNGAVELIRSRFGFYHAGIFLVDKAGDYAVLRAAASEAAPAMLAQGHKLKIGETGIVGNVTDTGLPRIALDVGADAVHFKNPHLPNTRSEMAIPLKIGGQIIGALDVQSEQEAAFDQDDIATLSTLADQVAIAIQNVRSHRRLLELDDLKTRFIANMSHELRTPLNAIINFSDFILKRRFGELTEQQESLQQRIMANGEHLLGLINDILDLSKIEAGKMELIQEEVSLKSLLEGVMSTAAGLTKDKRIQLTLEVAPEGLPSVWADEMRVRQIMLNLLSNAAKFTPAGGQAIV